MATFTLTKSGAWRAQVRRKGVYAGETFLRKTEAQAWAREAEIAIDKGFKPPRRGEDRVRKGEATLAHIIYMHLDDMAALKRPVPRSKRFVLAQLERELGSTPIDKLHREKLIAYGRMRAGDGAGPATVAIDFSFLHTVITHAAAVHGVNVSTEQVKLARKALSRLGLIGKPKERDRRPSQEELDHITAFLDGNPRQYIPAGRIVRFAVATAMRADEICRIRWADIDHAKKTALIRDRKDPRNKAGNNQIVPLLEATGYDAYALVQEQGRITGDRERIFPYCAKSLGTAFRRACRELNIEGLRFHDLRHEGTSRLFEAGFSIEQVALVTGHKDWKMLKRYANLKPETLHETAAGKPPKGRARELTTGIALCLGRVRDGLHEAVKPGDVICIEPNCRLTKSTCAKQKRAASIRQRQRLFDSRTQGQFELRCAPGRHPPIGLVCQRNEFGIRDGTTHDGERDDSRVPRILTARRWDAFSFISILE